MIAGSHIQNVPRSGEQSSQLLTMRDDPLHRDLALVLENVSSIPTFPHLGHPLFSVPTSNKAAAGIEYFKNPLVTPTTVFSKSDNQPKKQ